MKKSFALLLALLLALSGTAFAEDAAQAPTPITLFLSDVGVNFPDDFDPADNWVINQIAEWANVEFEEVFMPMSDVNTQFNLLVASGDMPDLVETAWLRGDMREYAEDGAFADITDIALIAENYTPIQIENMKSDDGRIYVLDSLPIDKDFDGLFLRVDLLEKAGYEGIPQTLDEFVEAMRAVKEWDPNAIVYTCRGVNYQHWFLTQPFNTAVSGWSWYPERNAYCNTWEGDNIVKSVEFAKMLYDEGLLDKEFITNDANTVDEKRLNENCLIWAQNRGGIYARMQIFAKTQGQDDARFLPVPMPVDPTCGRDAVYTAPGLNGGYTFAINANVSDEEYDACVRVLDALFSDEMRDLYVYGREGIEYEVAEDGSKVPLFPAAADSAWRETYGVAWTANTVESMNYYSISAIYSSAAFTEEQKAQYSADFINAFNEIDEKYLCKLDYSPTSFVTATDEITNATNECAEKQKNLYVEAVLGTISIEEFTAQKEALVAEYQFVTDWWNEQLAPVLETYDLTYNG